MAVDETLPTVVNEPAVDERAMLFVQSVVLLPAPDIQIHRFSFVTGSLYNVFFNKLYSEVPGDM